MGSPVAIVVLAMAVSAGAGMQSMNFDGDAVGALPAGWKAGVTGKGNPRWTVKADSTAPSRANVLVQTGRGTFPWCIVEGASIEDGFVEVKFKPVAGREDQAGGMVWRWKDGDNYYVARANALENNVGLYYTERGSRKTIRSVNVPVTANAWHTLRAEFKGSHIAVWFDGKPSINVDDTHIAGSGAVGVWTKADSETAFDDFAFGTLAR